MWAELTEPQRAHVQIRIDEFRASAARQREAARAAQHAEPLGARAKTDTDPAQQRPAPARSAPDLVPELRETFDSLPAPAARRMLRLGPDRLERALERLSHLTPEQRAQVLRRIGGMPARLVRPDLRTPPPMPPMPPMKRIDVPDPLSN